MLLPLHTSDILSYSLKFLLAALCYVLVRSISNAAKLRHIPTVGSSSLPILSFYGAIKAFRNGRAFVREGYTKHNGKTFKIPALHHWRVIVADPKLVGELYRAEDDELSFTLASEEIMQLKHTIGPDISSDAYHIPVVRSQLTRNLNVLFPDLRDELVAAFADEIPAHDEWREMDAMKAITQIVCRASNRIFVGLPLCRNAEYCDLNKRFTIEVFTKALFINLFPTFVKPLVGLLISNVQKSIAEATALLGPIISERLRMLEEKDELQEQPNDYLQWLIESATEKQRTVSSLVTRMLSVNMAAIHTSSITFSNALYHLAAYPEYIQPLREEVEGVAAQDGWTKTAMARMYKLDSFLKETQRRTGLEATSMSRIAAKDFTFSDGTFIPKGTHLSVGMYAIHTDEEIYPNASEFRPFRFSDMREAAGIKEHPGMVSTSLQWVPFGHGKHACPGRFFATNEIKAMFAHLVMEYDVKMEEGGRLPLVNEQNVKVLFRKRQNKGSK